MNKEALSHSLSQRLKALYKEELQTPEKIEAILTDFYQRMARDVMVSFFFAGHDLKHIVSQQKIFLLRAMGEAVNYIGRSPTTAHSKLPPILSGHFDRRQVLLRATLESWKLSSGGIQTWLDFENQFRSKIVQ